MSVATPRRNGRESRPNSASRSSGLTADEELVLECKAAYLAVVEDIRDAMLSKKDLTTALHYSGRSPSQKVIEKYWSKNTERMSFDDFCVMCKQEPPISAEDLKKAFKLIDQSGDGSISFNELKRFLITRGERMTESEFIKLMDAADINKDGVLDYNEFIAMALGSAKKCRQLALSKLEKNSGRSSPSEKASPRPPSGRQSPKDAVKPGKERKPDNKKGNGFGSTVSLRSDGDDDIEYDVKPVPRTRKLSGEPKKDEIPKPLPRRATSSTTTRSAISSLHLKLPAPKNLSHWTALKSRGALFIEENGNVAGNQYFLDVTRDTQIWLTIEPAMHSSGSLPIDVCVAVTNRKAASTNARRALMFAENRDAKGKYYIRGDLPAGKYHIVPFTSGCRLRRRKREPSSERKLIEKSRDGAWALSAAFKDALKQMFAMVDLDGNGLLSRSEFSLYNLRTSGDELTDEEWDVVKENAEMKGDELTLNGFLKLALMEAEDADGDEEDQWITLQSMGYNKGLILDEACPFALEVYAEDGKDARLSVCSSYILSNSSQLQDVLCDFVLSKGEGISSKVNKDVTIVSYVGDTKAAVVVENKSKERVSLELDLSQCRNVCTSSPGGTATTERVVVPARTAVVALHALPADEAADWAFSCVEKAK